MTPEQVEQAGNGLEHLKLLKSVLSAVEQGLRLVTESRADKAIILDVELQARLRVVMAAYIDEQIAATKARLADLGVTLDQC